MTQSTGLTTPHNPAPSPAEIRRLSATITATTAVIAAITITFSVLTATRFVSSHGTPLWAAPLVAVATDCAFLMSLAADAFLARYGLPEPGDWPKRLRWFTGLASVGLNDGQSIAVHDFTAVAIHTVAPALLLLLAEAGPSYRRAFSGALAAVEPVADAYPDRIPEPTEDTPEATTEAAEPMSTGYAPDAAGDAPKTHPERIRPVLPPTLLAEAYKINATSLETTGKPASVRGLMGALHIGQDKARAIRLALGGAQ
jgi:hypothetical protein